LTKQAIDLVVGMGEIGYPIYRLLSKGGITGGYDLDHTRMDVKKFDKIKNNPISMLHVCIPFTNKFVENVLNIIDERNPELVVIHSTISPHTTESIQKKTNIPVIYSATRGIHKRMLKDMLRYSKFYAVYDWAPKSTWASKKFANRMKKSGLKTKRMSNPLTLELAKIIVDTSYYGWLITYAQLSNMVAIQNGVNYDEMWSFADEIHKFLGNRPKMYPGFIGGHCVIPNLSLVQNETLNLIDKINILYVKKVKDAKLINKKYVKGKQSYDKK